MKKQVFIVIAILGLMSGLANASNTINKSEYAVFITLEMAKQSVQSQIWEEAFEACEGQAIPILLQPISYKTSGSGGDLRVVGSGEFNCGF